MTYMTKQQRAVLDCVRAAQGGCHAAALCESLHQKGEKIGLTTVYRQLERLEQQGLLHKIVTDEGARYQYCDAHEHNGECFLLKCENCGRIQHVDCSHLGELYRHLMADHGFAINPRKTLFYGLCEDCGRDGGSM